MLRRITILLFFIAIGTATAWAENWKADPFDKNEAEKVHQFYVETFSVEPSKLNDVISRADQYFKQYKHNYIAQMWACSAKANALFRQEKIDEVLNTYRLSLSIAKEHHNAKEYFDAYYDYGLYLSLQDPLQSIIEAHRMVHLAKEMNYDYGILNSHMLLGSVCYFQRADSHTSAREYEKALVIADRLGITEQKRFYMYKMLAFAYNGIKDYKKARDVMEKMRRLSVYEGDIDNQFDYAEVLLDWLYYNGTAEEYDRWYKRAFGELHGDQRFSGDDVEICKAHWLYKTGHEAEAIRIADRHPNDVSMLEMKSDYYVKTGNIKLATEFMRRQMDIKDSVRTAIEIADIAAMDAQLRNAELQQQANEHLHDAQQTRTILTFTVVISVVLILLLLFLHAYLQARRRERQATKLEELNLMKTQFIHNMTHELRTPINIINGFASILVSDDYDVDAEMLRESCRAISGSSTDLVRIADDVIRLSELDATEEAPLLATCCIASVVSEAIEMAKHIDSESVSMVVESSLPEGFCIHSNAQMLRHVMCNLISNAVKFTEQGLIRIDTKVDEGGKNLVFSVSDTGCGVPLDMEEVIFERFKKLNDFIPGTGLGLTVCRAIADRLGATVVLDRTYKEQGSRFVFTIPV